MRLLTFFLLTLLFACKNESNTPVQTTDIVADAKEIDIEQEQNDDLKVYDYDGLKQFLSTDSEKTYIINFWATWCAPCVKELPYFEEMNSNYQERDVEVILVSLDFPNKYDTSLKPFIKEKQLKSKVVALNDTNSNRWIQAISEDWSGAIPATLIFNKSKRQFYEQSFTYDELENEVKQFLK